MQTRMSTSSKKDCCVTAQIFGSLAMCPLRSARRTDPTIHVACSSCGVSSCCLTAAARALQSTFTQYSETIRTHALDRLASRYPHHARD